MTTNLTLAFSELRRLGYFARQNYQCCQSCAWGSIPEELAEKVVFYHNQDYYDFKQGHTFYLAWAGDGEAIVSVLQKWGLKVNWGGAENQRIGIAPSSIKKTKSTERQAYKSNTRQL
jgi:hypothetical protein